MQVLELIRILGTATPTPTSTYFAKASQLFTVAVYSSIKPRRLTAKLSF